MGNWIIRWNFDKSSYAPGQSASVSFWLENSGSNYLYVSSLELNSDFGTYNIEEFVSGMVAPRENKPLGNVSLLLPEDVVGRKIFTVNYQMQEYINNEWIDLGFYTSDKQYFISVYPKPFYKVFVSRGLRSEDRAIGDPIAEMIKEWGFETVTIGIEVKVPEEQVSAKVKEEIKKSDAVIAIATPRFLDAVTGLWKTLEWVHNEVGIAFGIDKPLLILKDKGVSLGGLPSYLAEIEQTPLREFDSYNLDVLKTGLSTIMPGFRDWIETKRRKEFSDALKKGLAVTGIAIGSGIIGYLLGSSRR